MWIWIWVWVWIRVWIWIRILATAIVEDLVNSMDFEVYSEMAGIFSIQRVRWYMEVGYIFAWSCLWVRSSSIDVECVRITME